ncbi:hypothetical protein [Bradyrhizobium lablabi]|uniref:hypothetical protein n=1 Tax=Bradyrhizobium lablabi TaxID=722472 RepID=UPI0012AB7838|nr:hypothetical protein [Bradyrhizobium lablabi]
MAKGQSSAALSGAGYKPARSELSTVVVNKSSHDREEFRTAKKSRFLMDFTPYGSHRNGTFSKHLGIKSPNTSGGRLDYLEQIVALPGRNLAGGEAAIFRDFAPYLSHNPATF